MKKSELKTILMTSFMLIAALCFSTGCIKDYLPNNGSKKPEWTYATGENPYGSKPWIAGNQLVVCSRQEGADKGSVHCVNLSDGTGKWKMTDSTVARNNPVVYNELVIYGGYNVHALNLSDGSHEWDYQDDRIWLALYTSPALADGYVYFGSTFSFIKLDPTNGALIWENTENSYQNMGLTEPFYYLGNLYIGTTLGQVFGFNASTGSISLRISFASGISNSPVVNSEGVFVGIMELNSAENSIFRYKLDGSEMVWSEKIWQVGSNMTIDGNNLYAVGGSTLYCLNASTGALMWKYGMPAGSNAQPAILNSKVYIGNGDELLCVDASTGKVAWNYRAGGKGFSSPAISGDRLYVACEDGNIYCFKI